MRLGIFLIAAIGLPPVASVFAQTIQLPSFSSFSVDTTVLVPDGGRAATAGTKRAGSGGSSVGGFPKQRAMGGGRQAAATHVLAKIHDPNEADQPHLRQGAVRGAKAADGFVPAKSGLAVANAIRAGELGLRSIAEIERQRANQSADRQREAFALYEKGRQAQTAGKTGAAAVFFRSAANRATGTLKQEIDFDLRALKGPANPTPGKSLKTTTNLPNR